MFILYISIIHFVSRLINLNIFHLVIDLFINLFKFIIP